jgi:hypothetical protein
VEASACAVLAPDAASLDYGSIGGDESPLETLTARRAGETLACGPLVMLALARENGAAQVRLTGTWRGRRAAVTLGVGSQVVGA